ncbi:MAG: chitobiase/beta-hexosaminidase C-terminal domain-containing protein, partial [Victivallales bacterium]
MKIEIQPGEERLASTPFDAFDSTLNFLLSGQLTGAAVPGSADQIKVWDSSVQGFRSAFLADGTGDQDKDGKWFKDNVGWEPSDILLFPGMGFFIKNNQLTAQSLFLSGRIPLDDSKILTLQPNLNLFAYPFSSKILLNSTNMKTNGAKGGLNQSDSPDILSTESPAADYWLMDNPADPNDGKWHDSQNLVSTLELKPGAGYWYERLGLNPFQWSEPRPYQNLFNLDATDPSIVDMVLNAAHDEVTLDIDCTGMPGETLEIFFKDMGADDSLATESGWSVADQNIASSGNTRILWTDAGRADAEFPYLSRSKINGTFMRIFIVSRQDIDSDSDGLSNGRERFVYGTNPENPDTDGDGISDGGEVSIYHTNPDMTDSDSDGYGDFQEINTYHTDPNNAASSPAAMPAGWTDADIGSPGAVGAASYLDGTFTVSGAGTDIYGTSDKFNCLYQDLHGDCEVVVRVVSQQNTNALAKAGIMIRESTAANARNAYVFITPGTGGAENCYYQERITAGAATARSAPYSATAYPYWLKLVKTGNVYSSYKSADGTAWTAMYTNRTVATGNAVKVGLAVTSMADAAVSTAVFDSFSITRTLTEAPAISPNGGYFQMNQLVALTTSVPDSQIRYTLDGSDPIETSALYTEPFTISSSYVLKARTFKIGYNPSPVSSAVFNQPGLMVKYYSGNWTTLPDFSALTPYKVSMIPNIDYPDNFGYKLTSGRLENLGAVMTGKINCPVSGSYTFYTYCSDGVRLYVDGALVVNYNTVHAFNYTYGSKTLTPGFHDIKVEYFKATGSG